MLYNDFTENLIGLQDLIVKNSKYSGNNLYIYAEMKRKPHICPCCGASTDKIHDYRTQVIKDIPAFGQQTYIVLRKRRYVCHKCKKRFYENVDFLPKKCQMTRRLVLYIIDKLKEVCSFTSVAKEVNLSVSSVIRIFDMVGYIKPKKLPRVAAIDEFKGNTGGEKYNCILTDLENGTIFDILPSRSSSYLSKYIRDYTREERAEVKYFVSDMWKPYTDTAAAYFPKATQVVDKYHFMRQCVWAFEAIRKREQKKYGKDNRLLFKHSKRLLIKKYEYLCDSDKEKVNSILYISQDLLKAYWFKEKFYKITKCKDRIKARNLMSDWIYAAQSSELYELKKCADTLLNWQKGILNSFEVPYTNGFTEGCNNKIKVLKRNAYGYRNFDRFRKRILHIFSDKKKKQKSTVA